MTDLKPKLFIGSSSSGYEVAEQVKQHLADICDVHLWKDPNIWDLGKSTLGNLIRAAAYFDFGIFVATADDLTFTKDKIVIEPRDNVILEMALFCGALGRDRSFLLVEEDIKLPSDFDGIYNPKFTRGDETSINKACLKYKNKIQEHFEMGHLSLYPTTALAIGYYKNFVRGLVESAQEAEEIVINGTRFSEFKLNIVLPLDFSGEIRERASLFYNKHGLVENTMKTKYRKHPAWFQLDPTHAPLAVLYDMPSTLTGIDDAIEMILQKGFHGRTKLQQVIEQRELNNFRRVLQMQIDKSPNAKAMVEIIDEF